MNNREIKFRAWDGEEMRNTFAITSYGETIMGGEEYPNWIIMQYTALKDKNGKEIYEGDLINSCQNDYQPTKVYWDESLATYCTQNFHSTLTLIDSMNLETEVIGNIYENPELL